MKTLEEMGQTVKEKKTAWIVRKIIYSFFKQNGVAQLTVDNLTAIAGRTIIFTITGKTYTLTEGIDFIGTGGVNVNDCAASIATAIGVVIPIILANNPNSPSPIVGCYAGINALAPNKPIFLKFDSITGTAITNGNIIVIQTTIERRLGYSLIS